MKKAILLLLSLAVISGCTSMQKSEPVTIEKNPRIIERDLTKALEMKRVTGSGFIAVQNEQKKNTLRYDIIEFANESIVLYKHDKLDAIVAKLKEGDQIYLIGHSHGWSKYGTSKLATGRTDTVSYHLKQKGIDPKRVHKLASWSKRSNSDSPARGVQIFVINKDAEPYQKAQLFLAQL